MYVIGIDYGHGETSAAVLEINDDLYMNMTSVKKDDDASNPDNSKEWNADEIKNLLLKSFFTLKDLKVKGEAKSIKSIMCFDWKNQRWDVGPNDAKLKHCISDLDIEQNQYPRLAAYFKGPLVSGIGEQNHSNSLSAISEKNREHFGIFLKNVFDSIIESNAIIHREPKNFRLYIACPSEWDKNQIEGYLAFLKNNGIPCEEIVEESRAAYMSFRDTILGNSLGNNDNSGILVVDFGSSTIDFTYYGGSEPVNQGYQHGAYQVETMLFDYMVSHEKSARKAYEKLTAVVGNNELLAKTLLVYALRNRKEKFYQDLGDWDDTILGDIMLKDLIQKPREFNTKDDCFGFDEEWGYKESQIEEILEDYIKVIESDFVDFKNKDGIGDIKYVILTGGASRMPFVRRLAESVYKVHKCTSEEIEKGMKDTLLTDDEPTFSISRGTAKYGTYRTLSDPIRVAIEQRLDATWRNINWVSRELDNLIPELVQQVYKDKFCSIIDEWKKVDSPIVSRNDETLYDVLDDIIKAKAYDDPLQIWKQIEESKKYFVANNHSLHALLRAIYNEIELKHQENRAEINNRIAKALTEKVDAQVKVLFEKYISIYFESGKLSPDTSLPQLYDVNVYIEESKKKKLLVDLIEKVFMKINESVLRGHDVFTLNCDRNADYGINEPRSNLSAPIKEVMGEFCKVIEVGYNIDKISTSCKKCIDDKFAEIKYQCELEPYHL